LLSHLLRRFTLGQNETEIESGSASGSDQAFPVHVAGACDRKKRSSKSKKGGRKAEKKDNRQPLPQVWEPEAELNERKKSKRNSKKLR